MNNDSLSGEVVTGGVLNQPPLTASMSEILAAKYNHLPSIVAGSQRGHALVKFFTSAEWAILPEKLEQLEQVLQDYIAGESVKMPGAQTETSSANGVAIVPMEGTLLKKAYGLSAMSGLRTTQDIQADIQAALDNPRISGIVLRTDSPGGTVDGTKELADFIASAKEQKPIVAYADGTMASAAYWVASAATNIVAFDTAKVGSVGVIVAHKDISEQEKSQGIKTTYIYQGKYKTAGNATEPLSSDSKDYIQGHVDTYYSLFVDAISENRSIARETVLSDIALGATFIGQEALKLNLVDSIGNLNDAISLALTIGEDKMADEKMAAEMKEMQDQLATMAASMESLATENASLKEEAEKTAEAEAARVRLEQVTEQFAGLKVTPEKLAMYAGLDDTVLSAIHEDISARQAAINETLTELGETTEGASSEDNAAGVPTSVDEAVALIEARDKVDVEVAMEKALAEFPTLFTNV